MRLFDESGKMPAGVRMMLEQMLRAASPMMAADVDVITRFVRTLDARLDRIENALGIANHGSAEQPAIDGETAERHAIGNGADTDSTGNSAARP